MYAALRFEACDWLAASVMRTWYFGEGMLSEPVYEERRNRVASNGCSSMLQNPALCKSTKNHSRVFSPYRRQPLIEFYIQRSGRVAAESVFRATQFPRDK